MTISRDLADRRDLHELLGPTVRAALDPGERARFEHEFRVALVEVTRSFDIDRLAEVVRRWWVTAGGDPAVAERDRDEAAHAATLTTRRRAEPRPAYLPANLVDRTGPAVRAALDEPARVEFDTQFEQALVAAETFDHLPARQVVLKWWAVALQHANPDDAAHDRELARQVEAGEVTTFVHH